MPDAPTFAHNFPALSKKEEEKIETSSNLDVSSLTLLED